MKVKKLILLIAVPAFIESCANTSMTAIGTRNTPTYTTDQEKIRQLREQLYTSYDYFLTKAQQIMNEIPSTNTNYKQE